MGYDINNDNYYVNHDNLTFLNIYCINTYISELF